MAKPRAGKIEKISVVEQVCNEIKENIISGEWKVGEKIPSESEIADFYGVNRLSVRMALQKLATLGVIETRVGEGSFVKEFSFFPVLNEMADFVIYADRMKDVLEMRYLIEQECAVKAAINCTEKDIVTLKAALDKYCEAFELFNREDTEQHRAAFVDMDLKLHMEIVIMSGNLLYLELYQMIQKLVSMHISELIIQRKNIQKQDGSVYKEMHIQLCNAIIHHDLENTKSFLARLLSVETLQEYMI